ncbi:MAG TPA: hypothetical protein VIO60_04645 [Rectinemataceae bacterium]
MKSKIVAQALLALAASVALALSSCMGMETEVKVSANGSGRVNATYRLSKELVSFGELEANKDMIPVPLSEADVLKSLHGLQGLKLVSWSQKDEAADRVIRTAIDFSSLDSLAVYLDPRGNLAKVSEQSGEHRISFSLGETIPPLDPEMRSLAKDAFSPYSFVFAFELPSEAKEASSSHPAIRVTRDGKRVRFEGSMAELVTLETPPSLLLSW